MRVVTLFLLIIISIASFSQEDGDVLSKEYMEKGKKHFELERYDEALQYFEKVILNDQNHLKAQIYRAQCMAFKGYYAKALEDLEYISKKNPEVAELRMTKGYIYSSLNEPWKAIKEFSKAIEIEPRNADYYYDRGCTFDDVEIADIAIQNYTSAINIDANVPDYFYNRGLAYEKIGRYTDAVTDYTKVIEMTPEDPAAFLSRAIAYIQAGDHDDKACADLHRAADEFDDEQAKLLIQVQCADD